MCKRSERATALLPSSLQAHTYFLDGSFVYGRADANAGVVRAWKTYSTHCELVLCACPLSSTQLLLWIRAGTAWDDAMAPTLFVPVVAVVTFSSQPFQHSSWLHQSSSC